MGAAPATRYLKNKDKGAAPATRYLKDKRNKDHDNDNLQTVAESKASEAPHSTKKQVVSATTADQTELNQAKVRLLPRKVTRCRSTRARSMSFAATLTEIDKIDVTDNGPCKPDLKIRSRLILDRNRSISAGTTLTGTNKTDVNDNGPCKPDLETCCQNISALIASCAAKNTTNGNDKYPVPTAGFVYGYMRVSFALFQLEPECCVYSCIYIKRLQDGTGVKIGARNWNKLLVVTLLLASKFVDDNTVTNKHFSFSLNGWSLKKINRLESVMLKALHWDIYVPISEYTMKYFELQQPTNLTTIYNWHVDTVRIKDYFNVNQNQYDEFIFLGLNLQFLQHIPPCV